MCGRVAGYLRLAVGVLPVRRVWITPRLERSENGDQCMKRGVEIESSLYTRGTARAQVCIEISPELNGNLSELF